MIEINLPRHLVLRTALTPAISFFARVHRGMNAVAFTLRLTCWPQYGLVAEPDLVC